MISMFCMMLSSCGIPEIRVFSSNFSYSTGSDEAFNINISGVSQADFHNPSPSVLLLYTISSNISDYLSTYSFNNTYAQTTHGIPVSFASNPMIATTFVGSGDERYETGFYPLIQEGSSYSDISAPGYTLSLYSYLNSGNVQFKFSISAEAENGSVLTLLINEEQEPIKFYRYNQKPFYTFSNIESIDPEASQNDYIQASKQETLSSTYINIYAAVNCLGDFSNVYWTDLKRVAQIEIPN